MKVTVLGSGAAYPRPGGACSGYLVEGGGVRVWMDGGNGTFSNLQKHMSYLDVDALVLSHVHGDHIADAIPLMYALGFDERFEGSLRVVATPEIPDVLQHPIGAMSREIFKRVFAFETLSTNPFEIGGLRFEPFRTVHPVETYGMRISEGDKLFVYSADTATFPELASHCRGADLVICEASFVEGMKAARDVHLWAKETGAVAREAGAARLVITHVWPTASLDVATAEAAETFGGDVVAALEGAVYSS